MLLLDKNVILCYYEVNLKKRKVIFMKKLLALILVLVMSVFVFAACESSEEKAAAAEEAVKTISAECLAKIVAVDEAALEYTVAQKGAEKVITDKLTALSAMPAKFDTAIDGWEISDENKEELKAYAAEKAAEIVASYAAGEVESVAVNGEKANVSCKATILNTATYSAAFTVDETEKAIKDMTIDELKATVDGIAEGVQACVVDTVVAFMLDDAEDGWVILNAGISAAE